MFTLRRFSLPLTFFLSFLQVSVGFTQTDKAIENDPSNTVGFLGLSEIRFQNRVLKFDHLDDFGQGSNLFGVTSLGLKANFLSLGRILPISFDVLFNQHGNASIHNYDISVLGDSFASRVNSYYSHKANISLLNFDREHLNEGGQNSLLVDRFKFINLKYTGYITLAPGVLKLTFSGQIAPLQGTRTSVASNDLNMYLKNVTHDPSFKVGVSDNAPSWEKIIGRMEIYHHHEIQNSVDKNGVAKTHYHLYEGFLGDSEFTFGVELFNFITAKAIVNFDGAQSVSYISNNKNADYFMEFSGTKRGLELEADFSKRFPNTKGLRRFVVFAKVTNEKSTLVVEEQIHGNVNKIVNDSYNSSSGTVGIKYRFGKWKTNK